MKYTLQNKHCSACFSMHIFTSGQKETAATEEKPCSLQLPNRRFVYQARERKYVDAKHR